MNDEVPLRTNDEVPLRVVRDGAVLRITVDREARHNPLSRPVLAALRRALHEHAHDEALRCALITGAGQRYFAAGGDLHELDAVRTPEQAREMSDEGRAALDAVRDFPVPVLAVMNGDALGGGAELALACDFRLMREGAHIGFVHGRLAITSAWGGGPDLAALAGAGDERAALREPATHCTRLQRAGVQRVARLAQHGRDEVAHGSLERRRVAGADVGQAPPERGGGGDHLAARGHAQRARRADQRGTQQCGHRHNTQGQRPLQRQRQRRHDQPGQHTAQRHAGLLDREDQPHAMRRCRARQDLRAGRRDRPIAQPEHEGARHRQPGLAAADERDAAGAQDERDLAAADRPMVRHHMPAEHAGHHRAEVGERDVKAHGGARQAQLCGDHRRHRRRRDQRGRGQRLDGQGDGQRRPGRGAIGVHGLD